ncbi:MAG TPA: Glu/Leu/Phe/Val dehydrogenase dimerization domain-containing protein [Thermoleophilaceae bacterium]
MPDTPLISLDHEELVIRRGRRSGVYTIVAVHSTALGPALGGCRMWRYESSADGARDALRLSRAMTFKTAACGLNVGGGKGVICLEPGRPPRGNARRDVLLDFADTVNVLEGSYITAEDVGTGPKDMSVIGEATKYVTGLGRARGGSGDPSPYTAMGVEAAMRACCEEAFGTKDLSGRTVAVVGAGRVGSQLAKRLAKAGAKLLVADIDESRRAALEKLPGAKWTDPTSAMLAEVDLLAPCALGGVIDQVNVDKLRCRVVCGAANNILAHEGLADDLAAEGILYAPDFIANAGGIINVSLELNGYEAAKARRGAAGIEQTMRTLLAEADAAGVTPLAAAYRLARRRLQTQR